jgi:hypothetical protein
MKRSREAEQREKMRFGIFIRVGWIRKNLKCFDLFLFAGNVPTVVIDNHTEKDAAEGAGNKTNIAVRHLPCRQISAD